MKRYQGHRTGAPRYNPELRRFRKKVVILADGHQVDLDPRFDLANHSPDGFEWGYHGSGPAQLALALLADATGDDELALRYYQDFKRKVIAAIDQDTWTIHQAKILHWVERKRSQETVEAAA